MLLSEAAAIIAKLFDLNDKAQYSKAVKQLQKQTGLNRQKCRNAFNQVKRGKS